MPRAAFLPARPSLAPEERALPLVHGDPRFVLFLGLRGCGVELATTQARLVTALPEATEAGMKAWQEANPEANVSKRLRVAAALGAYLAWDAWEDSGRPWPVAPNAYSAAREALTRAGGVHCVLAWTAAPIRSLTRLTAAAVQRRGDGLGLVLKAADPAQASYLGRERWVPVLGPGADALRTLADASAATGEPLWPGLERASRTRHEFRRHACSMPRTKYVHMMLREAFEDEGIEGLTKLTGRPYDELRLA